MESATFTSAEAMRNVFQANNVIPLIKVKAVNFTEDQLPKIAGSNKLVCFTNKKPTEIRVLDRIAGQKVDIAVEFAVSHMVAVTDTQFVAAGESSLAFIAADTHTDGSVTASEKVVTLEESVRAIAAAPSSSVVVLTASGQLLQYGLDGRQLKSFSLPTSKTVFKSSVLSVHREDGLAVVPGKGTSLDVVSINSEKSVLSKSWVPHGDDVPSSAVFLSRSFTGVKASSRCIVTAAHNNSELRFWTLGEDNTFTLVSQLNIQESEGEAPGPRLLSMTNSEENILLSSTTTSSIVVVELDRNQFKPIRCTDWNPSAPALFCTPVVRKLQEGKSLSIDQGAIVRSADTISMVVFDAARLVGAGNLGGGAVASAATPDAAASSSSSGLTKQSSVSKWFGAAAEAGTPSTPLNAPVPTSVSSSITGKVANSVDAQFVTRQAVSAIKAQTSNFREALVAIDNQIVALQKQASVSIKTLQDAKSKDDAQLAGREFALRNKNRLSQGQPQQQQQAASATGYATMTPAQMELMQGLKNFVDSIPSSVRDASSETCRKLLAANLPAAISKAMAAAETVEQDTALPKLSITEGMQQFGFVVDKLHQSQNNLLKQERNTVEALCIRLMQGTDRVSKTLQNSKAFLASLKSEVQGLKSDVSDAKDAVRASKSFGGVVAAPAPTAEQLLEEVQQMAMTGKWAEALTKLEHTGDLSLLMHFLLTDYVKENSAVVVSPSTLPLPLMVQLCYRLSMDLKSQLGNAPFRARWLHDFLVDWDDSLQEIKEKNAKAFAVVREPLEMVLSNLEEVDLKKEVDRSTKNQLTLCRKILQNLLN